MKILLFLATAAFGLGTASAAADECPTKENAKKGFIVERGARSKTEVFHSGDSEVRTVSKYNGSTYLQVTLYQGLSSWTAWTAAGGRSSAQERSGQNVSTRAAGKKITALFEQTEGERKGNLRTFVLEVSKKSDTLSLGGCKYKVLRIDRSVLNDKSKPVFVARPQADHRQGISRERRPY